MDIVRSFTYVTEDNNWQSKVPVTLIIGIIPLVNLAVVGWMLDLIRNMLDGVEHPMPDWNDLSTQFMERWVAGLMTAIAMLLYMIPMVFIAIVLGIVLAIMDSGLVSLCMSFFTSIYVALAWLPLSIAMMRYSRTREFGHYLQLSRNINLAQQNFSVLLIPAIFVFVVGVVLGIIGRIPCIGPLLTLFSIGVNAIVTGHLTGQAAVEIANRMRGAQQ